MSACAVAIALTYMTEPSPEVPWHAVMVQPLDVEVHLDVRGELRSAWTQLAAAALGHVGDGPDRHVLVVPGRPELHEVPGAAGHQCDHATMKENSHAVPVQQAPCLSKGAILYAHSSPYVGLRTPLWTRRAPRYHIYGGKR